MSQSLRLFLLLWLLPLIAAAQVDSLRTAEKAERAEKAEKTDSLGEATVTATRLLFVNRADTVIYNMDALMTDAGSSLGEVIERFPGFELKKGQLYYKGKAVDRLMVNGTDFMKGKTSEALSNLPAYIIKSLKAYERKSDISMITGIDDGTRERCVDVILKRKYLGTWTGNLHGGYGTDDYWLGRAFANTFGDRYRFSLFGALTNTAQYQNVSDSGDWSEAGEGSGETIYKKPGFSFFWRNRREEFKQGYLKLSGDASFDYRRHNDRYHQESRSYLEQGDRFDASRSAVRNTEEIYWADFRLDWSPTDSSYVQLEHSFNNRSWRDHNDTDAGQWDSDPFARFASPLDSLARAINEATSDEERALLTAGAINYNRSANLATTRSNNYSHNLYATHKLTASGLRLSLRQQLMASPKDRTETFSLTDYTYFREAAAGSMEPLINRYSDNRSKSFLSQSFLDFDAPIRKWGLTLKATYGLTNSKNRQHNDGYRLDRLGGIFDSYNNYRPSLGILPTEADWKRIAMENIAYLRSEKRETKHWAEGIVTYQKGIFYGNLKYTGNFGHESLDYQRGLSETPLRLRRHLTTHGFQSRIRLQSDSVGTLQLVYNYQTRQPNLTSMVTIPNLLYPLHTMLGNPNLRDMRNHSLTLDIDRTFKRQNFLNIGLISSFSRGNVSNRTFYNPTTGATTTQPFNVDGNRSLDAYLSSNVTLDRKMRWSLNIYTVYSYSHNVSFATMNFNGGSIEGLEPTRQKTDINTPTFQLRLSYRTDKFQFNILTSHSFSRQKSNIASADNRSQRQHMQSMRLNYKMPWKMQLASDLNVKTTISDDLPAGFDRCRIVWDASLSQPFLESRLTLKLTANDILNRQAQSYYTTNLNSQSTFWRNQVGRYFMLHAIWRFSSKKKGE